ncbi:MAG: TIGR00341 family protein [Candidatus Kerfeldbacteria bacterium]
MPKQTKENKIEKIEDKLEKTLKKPVKKAARFLQIDEDRKKKVIQDIKERAKPDLGFVLMTVFSTIIVALGLIIDNPAVVIGGMIISPLLWPILALAIAIIKGSVSQLKKQLFTILKVTLIIFIVSFVISIFSPFLGESREVLLRTEPTLFELFIALAAGFIGTFAVAHPKLSGALAGVVAAVALVPPLSVMGILFAEGSYTLATGAALLYFTNLIAITLAAVILFLLVGVEFPQWEKTKNRAVSNISWFVIFLIIIAIPLTLVMKGVIKENKETATIKKVIEEYTVSTKVTSLVIDHHGDIISIQTTINSPYEITSRHVDRLSDILIDELNSSINLIINVVPTYEANKNLEDSDTVSNAR